MLAHHSSREGCTALFGLHRTEQKKKRSFPPSPVGERLFGFVSHL